MALKTVLNKIIVEPVEAETKTASGIIIPDSAKEKPQNRWKSKWEIPFYSVNIQELKSTLMTKSTW